jgi:hypothetical protein
MDENQHEHFHNLMFLLQQIAEPKYEKGAIEHNSNLWDYTDEQLEAAELEEIIDLLTYRLARLLKRKVDNGSDPS